jgi:EF hand
MWRRAVGGAAVAWLLLGTALSGVSADPPKRVGAKAGGPVFREWLGHSVPRMRPPEFVEMLTAIAGGSQMGPGEGWFHPAQSRYGWQWLAGRYDADDEGEITREEFPGPAEWFDRLDRNRDGVLTPDDFDWSERSPQLRQGGLASQWFRALDTNSNGRISRQEWEAFFKKAAKGKDHLTPDDLQEALAPPPRKPSKEPPGPSPVVLALGLLNGEIGSMFEGPNLNQPAPDFVLKTQDGKRPVRLSEFRGKRPVVLIFGSFT